MLAEFAYQGFTKEKFFPLPFFHRVPAISESFKTSRYIVCVTIHPVIASPCMSVVPPRCGGARSLLRSGIDGAACLYRPTLHSVYSIRCTSCLILFCGDSEYSELPALSFTAKLLATVCVFGVHGYALPARPGNQSSRTTR